MNIKRFKEVLPYLIDARISTLVWGVHGIGKSESVKQFCKENSYHFTDLRLSNAEVGDLLGLPDFIKDHKDANIATKFMMPDVFKEVIEYCSLNPHSKAIIFLDEINRARRDVLQAIFQLVLDNRIHTTQFPTNCYVLAAANPNTADYIVNDIEEAALMDRFCHIKLTSDVSCWLDYAQSQRTDLDIINFIRLQPDMLRVKQDDFTLTINPSERSWVMVDKVKRLNPPLDTLKHICYGLLGSITTLAFIESLNIVDKPFSAYDVLDSFDQIKNKLAAFCSTDKGIRSDILSASCENTLAYIKEKEGVISEQQTANLLSFIKSLPESSMVAFIKKLYKFDKIREILNNDDVVKDKIRRKLKDV